MRLVKEIMKLLLGYKYRAVIIEGLRSGKILDMFIHIRGHTGW